MGERNQCEADVEKNRERTGEFSRDFFHVRSAFKLFLSPLSRSLEQAMKNRGGGTN